MFSPKNKFSFQFDEKQVRVHSKYHVAKEFQRVRLIDKMACLLIWCSQMLLLTFKYLKYETDFCINCSIGYINLPECLIFLNLTKIRASQGMGNSMWNCLHQICLLLNLYGIFLSNNWCGRYNHTVHSVTPGQVDLGCIRKQVEKALECEHVAVFFVGFA